MSAKVTNYKPQVDDLTIHNLLVDNKSFSETTQWKFYRELKDNGMVKITYRPIILEICSRAKGKPEKEKAEIVAVARALKQQSYFLSALPTMDNECITQSKIFFDGEKPEEKTTIYEAVNRCWMLFIQDEQDEAKIEQAIENFTGPIPAHECLLQLAYTDYESYYPVKGILESLNSTIQEYENQLKKSEKKKAEKKEADKKQDKSDKNAESDKDTDSDKEKNQLKKSEKKKAEKKVDKSEKKTDKKDTKKEATDSDKEEVKSGAKKAKLESFLTKKKEAIDSDKEEVKSGAAKKADKKEKKRPASEVDSNPTPSKKSTSHTSSVASPRKTSASNFFSVVKTDAKPAFPFTDPLEMLAFSQFPIIVNLYKQKDIALMDIETAIFNLEASARNFAQKRIATVTSVPEATHACSDKMDENQNEHSQNDKPYVKEAEGVDKKVEKTLDKPTLITQPSDHSGKENQAQVQPDVIDEDQQFNSFNDLMN